MIDWAQNTGFEWDDGNSRKNVEKHDVGQSEAEQIFFNHPLVVQSDTGHSQKEARFHALGTTDEARLLHLTFTLRAAGRLIRVISARDTHRKERVVYEKSQKGS